MSDQWDDEDVVGWHAQEAGEATVGVVLIQTGRGGEGGRVVRVIFTKHRTFEGTNINFAL